MVSGLYKVQWTVTIVLGYVTRSIWKSYFLIECMSVCLSVCMWCVCVRARVCRLMCVCLSHMHFCMYVCIYVWVCINFFCFCLFVYLFARSTPAILLLITMNRRLYIWSPRFHLVVARMPEHVHYRSMFTNQMNMISVRKRRYKKVHVALWWTVRFLSR